MKRVALVAVTFGIVLGCAAPQHTLPPSAPRSKSSAYVPLPTASVDAENAEPSESEEQAADVEARSPLIRVEARDIPERATVSAPEP